MKIGYLDALEPNRSFRFQRFGELAHNAGSEIEFSQLADHGIEATTVTWSSLRRFIDECDALIVPNDTILHVPDYVQGIHDRIAKGCRVLVQLDENCLEKQNGFLARYDLAGSRIRIRSDITPVISLKRSAEHFRDVRLFAGVETVEAQQPNAIWYGGESLPVLIASDEYLAINGETDLPSDWNARELACIAAWHGDEGGGVLAMSGGYFHDPYAGPTGVQWPGIQPNERLAQNVLTYLLEGRPATTPENRCQRIEINLVDFVLGILKSASEDWWTEFVPLNIRQKCAQRQEEEKNRLPKEAYFDLIDLKSVIQKNWPQFEQHLRSAGCEGGKDKALSWLDKLNELRRLVGHPLKKHVSGYSFTKDERDLLLQCDETARRLKECVDRSEREEDSDA